MAKRGRKPGSKNKKSSRKNSKNNINIAILIILSLLLAVLIYGKTGSIGEHLSPILGGIFGWIKYLIPIGVFMVAISMACDNKRLSSTKIFELLVFLICISSILSVYQISNNTIDVKSDFSKNIETAYNLGSKDNRWRSIRSYDSYSS